MPSETIDYINPQASEAIFGLVKQIEHLLTRLVNRREDRALPSGTLASCEVP